MGISRWKLLIFAGSITILALCIVPTTPVSADNQPKMLLSGGSTLNSDEQSYLVGYLSYWNGSRTVVGAVADETKLGAYFPAGAQSGTIAVYPYSGACSNHRVDIRLQTQAGNLLRSPETVTHCGNVVLNVNLAGVPVDPSTGYKVVLFTARSLRGETNNIYRFRVGSEKATIRQVAGGVTSYEVPGVSYRTNRFGRYRVAFGSDCTVSQPTRKTITLVDQDNYYQGRAYGDPSAQGRYRGGANYTPETMTAYIIQIDPSGRGSVLPQSSYSGLSNVFTQGSGDGFRLVPHGRLYSPELRSQFSILMQPGYRYELVLENMKVSNTFQIQLPTDSIYYDKPCQSWSVRGESYVKKGSTSAQNRQGFDAQVAKPGEVLYWDHDLRNNSSQNMLSNVKVDIDHTEVPISQNPGSSGNILPSPGPNGWVGRGNANELFYKRYNVSLRNQPGRLVSQNDVGKRLCQRVSWIPGSWSNSSWAVSQWACATVPYNYSLTPNITLSSSSINEGETRVGGIAASVANSGPTKSNPANYAVIRFVVRGDQSTHIAAGDSVVVPDDPRAPGNLIGDWPCEIARQIRNRSGLNIDSTDCSGGGLPVNGGGTVVQTGGMSIAIAGGSNDITGLNITTGDRVCYTTIVSTYSPSVGTNTFRYAQPACLNVAKKPKVQFWGGDVRSGVDVTTAMTYRHPAYFGSWAEYAIMASGTVQSSSGAGLSSTNSGREGLVGAAPQVYNALTFANTPNLGGFNTLSTVAPPGIIGASSPLGSSTVKLSGLASGVYTHGGNVTIDGGELAAGRRIVIRSGGTVVISGNITYSGDSHSTATSVPQLIIIAQNIIVKDSVTEISGWLIAQGSGNNGYISTCNAVLNPGEYVSDLSSKVCDKILKVNGPLVANRLYLRRTHGANMDHPGLPAEILNLRPDVYIASYGATLNSGAIKTTYLRELPPRF